VTIRIQRLEVDLSFLRFCPLNDQHARGSLLRVKIGCHKLAELPGFVLGLGNDLRMRGLPLCEEFVHLSLAIEIQPEKDRACVAVGLSEGAIGDKKSAIPPCDAGHEHRLEHPTSITA
jgi:hypothetical protein